MLIAKSKSNTDFDSESVFNVHATALNLLITNLFSFPTTNYSHRQSPEGQ